MKTLAPLFVLLVMGSVLLAAPQTESREVTAIVAEAPQPATILMFGDLMLDRSVRVAIEKRGIDWIFTNIAPIIANHDLVVANAEGVFSGNESISQRDHTQLLFTFSTSSLPFLKSLGFSIFSQANNHALNFGWPGLRESQSALQAAGIETFGDPENSDPGPLYESVRGELIAFVGYDEFSSRGGNSSTTLAVIGLAKENGAFVIVYPHWGQEYNLGTTSLQTLLAHKFVDAGADLVVGSHPHVVEPQEIYKGKAIFYSLGNFVFDQYWNSDVKSGLAVELSLTKETASYRLIPFMIENLQPTPMGEERTFELKRAQ